MLLACRNTMPQCHEYIMSLLPIGTMPPTHREFHGHTARQGSDVAAHSGVVSLRNGIDVLVDIDIKATSTKR